MTGMRPINCEASPHALSADASVRPRASARAAVRPDQFKIGPIGGAVLAGLNGERTISDLIVRGLGDIDRLDMLRLVFLFLETGLVADSAN